ncbi:TB2/DP1, HVA22 family-domain-containing protein [Paraphysoderma sedebokerense]|nr:TB2/DP1, HVA22 family-domain-containing protein [Paraphysoderma sedebokerense]
MFTYIISKFVCHILAYIYPAYRSYKAIKARDEQKLTRWLKYWTVISIFSIAEWFGDLLVFWLPFYYEAKIGFVLWLILPQTQGATTLYTLFVEPTLLNHEDDIDHKLEEISNDLKTRLVNYGSDVIKITVKYLGFWFGRMNQLVVQEYAKSVADGESVNVNASTDTTIKPQSVDKTTSYPVQQESSISNSSAPLNPSTQPSSSFSSSTTTTARASRSTEITINPLQTIFSSIASYIVSSSTQLTEQPSHPPPSVHPPRQIRKSGTKPTSSKPQSKPPRTTSPPPQVPVAAPLPHFTTVNQPLPPMNCNLTTIDQIALNSLQTENLLDEYDIVAGDSGKESGNEEEMKRVLGALNLQKQTVVGGGEGYRDLGKNKNKTD